MEEKSGIKFNQARVALSRQWIGELLDGKILPKEVTLRTMEPTTEGIVISDKTPSKTETIPVPSSEEEARQTIEKFERGAEGVRGDQDVSDTISQHMLHDKTGLRDEKWHGTEEEELNAYVFGSLRVLDHGLLKLSFLSVTSLSSYIFIPN